MMQLTRIAAKCELELRWRRLGLPGTSSSDGSIATRITSYPLVYLGMDICLRLRIEAAN